MGKRKLGLGLALGLLSVLGGATALAGTWSSVVQIASVEIDDTGSGTSTYLSFTTTPSGKPACGTSGQVMVSGSADNVKAITAAATAAYLAGRSVKMYWDGTCNGGYAKFPAFTAQ